MSLFAPPNGASPSPTAGGVAIKVKKRIIPAAGSSSGASSSSSAGPLKNGQSSSSSTSVHEAPVIRSHSQSERKRLEQQMARKRMEQKFWGASHDPQPSSAKKSSDSSPRKAKQNGAGGPSSDKKGKKRARPNHSDTSDSDSVSDEASDSQPHRSPNRIGKKTGKSRDDSRGPSETPRKKAASLQRRSGTITPIRSTPSRSRTAVSDEESSSNEDGNSEAVNGKGKKPVMDIKQPIQILDGGTRQFFDFDSILGTASSDSSSEQDTQSEARSRRWTDKIDSSRVVKQNIKAYMAYFPQEGFEYNEDPNALPCVTLAYPAKDCYEEFVLLTPRKNSDYAPIPELFRTIGLLVDTFIPPNHKHLFGHVPTADTIFTTANDGNLTHVTQPTVSSPAPSSTPGTPSAETDVSATSASAVGITEEPIIRALHKAFNRQDGPGFVRAVGRFNEAFIAIRDSDSNQMETYLKDRATQNITIEAWDSLAIFVGEQVYQRVVGPKTDSLRLYEPFSDNVYGELLPNVDLGSGVGNALIGMALLTGSDSYGCESMPNPSDLARQQITEARNRWAMWGLHGAEKCVAYEGDFCSHPGTVNALRAADLVLVNNYAFTPRLNDALSYLFLELKEGAKIISLKPFLPGGFRLTDRTADSPLAILKLKARNYPSNSVSWTNEGGRYYEHTVDHRAINDFYTQSSGRAGRGR